VSPRGRRQTAFFEEEPGTWDFLSRLLLIFPVPDLQEAAADFSPQQTESRLPEYRIFPGCRPGEEQIGRWKCNQNKNEKKQKRWLR
jgi:hypothetical protein